MNVLVTVLFRGHCSEIDGSEVSEGGMAIVGVSEMKAGSLVVVSFHLPGHRFVTTRAEVAYVRSVASPAGKEKNSHEPALAKSTEKFTFGLKFIGLKFQYRRLIREYISEKTQLESDAEMVDDLTPEMPVQTQKAS